MNEATDLALETLLKVRSEIAPNLDEALLRRCYEIQQRHQFDQTRDASFAALERAIDDTVQQSA